jgi:hypothetical protein
MESLAREGRDVDARHGVQRSFGAVEFDLDDRNSGC